MKSILPVIFYLLLIGCEPVEKEDQIQLKSEMANDQTKKEVVYFYVNIETNGQMMYDITLNDSLYKLVRREPIRYQHKTIEGDTIEIYYQNKPGTKSKLTLEKDFTTIEIKENEVTRIVINKYKIWKTI